VSFTGTHCSFSPSPATGAGDPGRTSGIGARFRLWTLDRAIAAAFMDERRNRSSSPTRRSGGWSGSSSGGARGERGLVINRVVRDGGKDKYPLLTKSNYYSWAAS